MHDRRSDDLFAFAFFRAFFIAPGLVLKTFISESLLNLFLAEVIGFLGLVTGADGVAEEKVSSTSASSSSDCTPLPFVLEVPIAVARRASASARRTSRRPDFLVLCIWAISLRRAFSRVCSRTLSGTEARAAESSFGSGFFLCAV